MLDRYNGTYSGGKWTAWNLSYVPSKIDADDTECADFFAKNMIVYGRGETPQEAIDDLKMILNCGIPDPDEEDEDEEEEKMEPTSVWKIENIDNIWITQGVDGMSLMLKNKDDLTKIVMTGEAIDNYNNTFVISLQADMIKYAKKMRKLEKENYELKAKSKDISDDNASLLETNKNLKKENDKLKKELDLEKAANEAQRKFIKEYAGNDTEVTFNYAICSGPITYGLYDKDYVDELRKKNNNLIAENAELKAKLCYKAKSANDIKKLKEQNKKDEEPADNVNHPSHYTGKYECIDVMQDVFGDEATNDFCLCNAFKYIWRARKKNGLEDVKKAVWYLNKYIEEAEKDGEDEVTRTRD